MTDNSNSFDGIETLEELWSWVREHRTGAWRFPERDRVMGYKGDAPLAIVGDVPGERSLEYRDRGLPYPDDSFCSDIFNRPEDKQLYRLIEKYGLHNAHLMDASVSCISPPDDDPRQDERLFLKQIELINSSVTCNE